jgi:hypothetical protein
MVLVKADKNSEAGSEQRMRGQLAAKNAKKK